MNRDDILKMDRFKIYDSKKSLYERGIKYIEEGNLDEGIQTLELLVDADPDHKAAKEKLLEIYSKKIKALTKNNQLQDAEKIRGPITSHETKNYLITPTELERSEVEFYLSQDVDGLLIMLGQSSAGALGAEFSPETAKKKGLEWLETSREQLRIKICEQWSYRKNAQLPDNVVLATTIGHLIIPVVGEIPPLAVACLLMNMGLDDFCRSDNH